MTFAEEIEERVGKDKILAIQLSAVRGESMGYSWGANDHPFGRKAVSWKEARKHLDYNYDAGYGGQDCHSVYIWTEDEVFFVYEYDGSTWLASVPRNFG